MTLETDGASMGRRGFFRAGAAGAAAAAGIAASSGSAAAAYGGWLDDVPNYDGTYDYRGEDEVHVTVGAGDDGLLFDPAAILIDEGTTVVWEWTGEGGEHNVAAEDDTFESELVDEAGHVFEFTFDDVEDGDVFNYVCTPHEPVEMKGGIAIGEVDDELIDPDGEDDDDGPAGNYGGWLDEVPNYDGTYDYRGEEEIHVTVGAGDDGLLFDPAAIVIDEGATVVWEWTGEGGAHNVASVDDVFESELTEEEGHVFEFTFDDAEQGDVFNYVCTPHEAVEMKGGIAIGDVDDEIVGGPGADNGDEDPVGRELTSGDLGALALAFGFAGALLVPLFYAAHRKAQHDD